MAFVLPLLVIALLAGCSGPSDEATEDVRGPYESGIGVALAVTNEANGTATVTLRLLDADDREVGADTATVGPGKTVVRRYAVDGRVHVSAAMSYQVDSGGRASSGNDAQSFDLLSCDELTRASWRIVGFDGSHGSQWLGTRCEGAS